MEIGTSRFTTSAGVALAATVSWGMWVAIVGAIFAAVS